MPNQPSQVFADRFVEMANVKCPNCGELVSEHRIKRHISKVHSPLRELQARVEQLKHAEESKRRELLSQSILCPDCHLKIKLGNVKSHFGTVHAKPAPAHFLSQLEEAPQVNRFRNDREREAYWRKQLGPTNDGDPSNDVFDSGHVVSGGAYGLGKNRRH